MRRVLFATMLAAASGCFSSAPDPTPDPTVPAVHSIWSLPTSAPCCSLPYIGSVVIDQDRVFGIQQQSQSAGDPTSLWSVAKDGSGLVQLEPTIGGKQDAVHIAIDADAIYFAVPSSTPGQSSSIDFFRRPKAGGPPTKIGTGKPPDASAGGIAGLAVDAQAVYLAVSSVAGDPNNPQFVDQGPTGGTSAILRFDRSSQQITALTGGGLVLCGHACLYSYFGILYWFEGNSDLSSVKTLVQYDPSTAAVVTRGLNGRGSPVGLAANSTSIVIAQTGGTSQPGVQCTITRMVKPQGALIEIVSDPTNTCNDIAVDETDAYYPFVRPFTRSGGGPGQGVEGYAIGSVPVAGGATRKTLALFRTDVYGVLRVRVDANNVYGIDPQHLLVIPKTLFN